VQLPEKKKFQLIFTNEYNCMNNHHIRE